MLFGVLSAHLGNALARAIHYEQARDLAVALQHSVLGQTALPAGFGVRYRPAMRPLEVGGDWYDVISLGRDRFGVVVGDCVGRGLDAAVTMGQLRSACRALLLRDAAPAQVLTDLDSFAERVSGAACSTVFCAIIDVAAASIRYSSAGHPPGILAHPGGSCAELLDRATTVPLAVTARQQRTEATALLGPAPRCCSIPTDSSSAAASGWTWVSGPPRSCSSSTSTAPPMSWPTGSWPAWSRRAASPMTAWCSPTARPRPGCG